MNENEIPTQKFTGYWIPVELDRLGLNRQEQWLLAMIDSLDSGDPGYCFASNAYLAEKLQLSESRISFYITRLKRMNLLQEVGFDGRRRRLKSLRHNWYLPQNSKKELCVKTRTQKDSEDSKKELCVKTTMPGARNHVVRVRENEDHIQKNIEKSKEVVCSEPPPVAPVAVKNLERATTTKHPDGQEIEVTLQDVFSEAVMKKQDWDLREIEEAWQIMCDYKGPIRSWFAFIGGTIQKLRNNKQHAIITKKTQDKKCKPQNQYPKKPLEASSEPTTEKGTLAPTHPYLASLYSHRKN